MKQLSLQRCVADCWKRRNIIDMKYDKERGRGPAATLVQEQDFLMVSCAAQGMSWGYLLCGTLLATGNPLIRCSLRLLVCVLFLPSSQSCALHCCTPRWVWHLPTRLQQASALHCCICREGCSWLLLIHTYCQYCCACPFVGLADCDVSLCMIL